MHSAEMMAQKRRPRDGAPVVAGDIAGSWEWSPIGGLHPPSSKLDPILSLIDLSILHTRTRNDISEQSSRD